VAETWLQKENNAVTTLAADCTDVAPSIVVASIVDLPALFNYHLTIFDAATYTYPGDDPNMEIVEVTGAAGTTLTVTRAQEGTAGVAHTSGDRVALNLTKASTDEYEAAIDLNTTHRGSNGTDHGYIDQDVQTSASPTFAGFTQVGGTADKLMVAADGELTFAGTGRVYQKVWVPAQGLRAPGIKAATYTDLGISGVWEFADGQEQIVVGNVMLPANRAFGEDIDINIGWSSPTISQDCDWEVAYLLTAAGEATNGAAQQTLQGYKTSAGTAHGLVMSAFTIDSAQIADADVCIHLNIMRDGNDGSDNLGAAAHLHGLCLRVMVDKLGTPTT